MTADPLFSHAVNTETSRRAKTMPSRKPTETKVLAGTFRKDRSNPEEPQPKISAPKCPDHLAPAARTEWKRITKLLLECRVLAESHLCVVAEYCQLYSRTIDLAADYQRQHECGDEEAARKILRLEIQLSAELRHREGLLGITPADQARVRALPPTPVEDPLEELRNRRRR